jgi:hypothetical protein
MFVGLTGLAEPDPVSGMFKFLFVLKFIFIFFIIGNLMFIKNIK